MSKSHSPIYLVSIPRSGATLLGAMLNAHPNIAMFNEPWFFLMLRKYGTLQKKYNIELLVNDLCFAGTSFGYQMTIEVKEKILSELFARRNRLTHVEAFGIFLQHFSESIGKPRWGVKQPLGIYDVPRMLKQFPELKVLHIVRDPRSTVAYRMGKSDLKIGDLSLALKYAKSWRDCLSFARESLGLNSSNYFEVRYEDLVVEPSQWLSHICAFIDDTYSPEMQNYHKSSNLYVPRDSVGNIRETHTDVVLPVHTDGVTAWTKLLAPSELEVIEKICVEEMVKRNYEPVGARGEITNKQMLKITATYYKRNFMRHIRVKWFHMAFHLLRRAYIFIAKS
jgi:hypothetical protein